jgi:hypothetical protein
MYLYQVPSSAAAFQRPSGFVFNLRTGQLIAANLGLAKWLSWHNRGSRRNANAIIVGWVRLWVKTFGDGGNGTAFNVFGYTSARTAGFPPGLKGGGTRLLPAKFPSSGVCPGMAMSVVIHPPARRDLAVLV